MRLYQRNTVPHEIVAEACERVGMSVQECLGRNRKANAHHLRQKVMLVLSDAGWNASEIGRALNRDPGSVASGIVAARRPQSFMRPKALKVSCLSPDAPSLMSCLSALNSIDELRRRK